jgi:hypothetical protein
VVVQVLQEVVVQQNVEFQVRVQVAEGQQVVRVVQDKKPLRP